MGALIGLTGVGGGSLMTPLLVLLFGFHPATAVGTDLLYASVTKSVGTAVHHKGETVDWKIVGALASGSVPTAILTLGAMAYFGVLTPQMPFARRSRRTGAQRSLVLHLLLGVALLLTGLAVLFRPWILRWAGGHIHALDGGRVRRLTVVIGATLGVLVSITSVGAGALGTTALPGPAIFSLVLP